MNVITRSLPMGHLRSPIEDSNINVKDRTVEIVFSTGSKGMRQGWDGPYYEELSMSPDAVDLSRLNNGAPLLANHNTNDLNAVVGVIERAWLDGNQGKAIVRFSSDPEADKIFQKVQEKILRNLSIGYQVRKYVEVTQKGDKLPTYRAVDYTISEVSIVPVGFDDNAKIRKNDNSTEVLIETSDKETTVMPNSNSQDAVKQERERQTQIRSAVRSAKLDELFADQLCEQGVSADQARKMVLEKLAEKQPEPIQPSVRVEIGTDERDKRSAVFENALMHRINPLNAKLESGRPLAGRSMIYAAEFLVGRRPEGMSDAQFIQRALSSSDLPLALANVASKSLVAQYQRTEPQYKKFVRQEYLKDFNEHSLIKAGDYPSLQQRQESGEFKRGYLGEDRETAQLLSWGNILELTRNIWINDHIGILQNWVNEGGVAVARLENQKVFNILTSNPDMNDSVALFHNDHGNLGTAGKIESASIGEAVKLMMKQKTVDELDFLNLVPKFLICGPDKMVEARQALADIYAATSATVNPFSGSMELIVDANISGNKYFFIADPALVPGISCFYLEGSQGPTVTTRVHFETSNLQFKIEHDFVAKAVEAKSMVYNAGN